jgi:predicted ABC-type ATPase
LAKLIVFAGPNGSGKSTLYLTNRAFFDIPRVNVDEIVREIGGDWRKSADLIRAGKIALRRAKDCLEKRVSFNRETTLCGKTAVQDIVEAKKLGFEVELYFVYLSSVDVAKERIRHRVACGGHGIPEADIERRYEESLRRLQDVMPLCDKVELYDNSAQFVKVLTFKNSRLTYSAENIPDWAKKFLEA